MKKKVIAYPNKGLQLPCRKATDVDAWLLEEMTKEMDTILKSTSVGIALAANQAYDNSTAKVPSCFYFNNILFINPKIVEVSENRSKIAPELCLSHPDGHDVTRYSEVVLQFDLLEDGKLFPYTKRFTGFPATVIQHEVDHLNGIGVWNKGVPFFYN